MSKKDRVTDEELFAEFEGIEDGSKSQPGSKPQATNAPSDAEDVLKEFGIPERPKSSGRLTPKLASSATTSTSKDSSKTGAATPPSNDGGRSSEEKVQVRKSGESARSFHNSFTPASTDATEPDTEKPDTAAVEAAKATAGGWWSTLTSTASAAVKQAEALAKEIQHNEEAQRWAEQVKGNVTQLRGIGRLMLLAPYWRLAKIYRW